MLDCLVTQSFEKIYNTAKIQAKNLWENNTEYHHHNQFRYLHCTTNVLFTLCLQSICNNNSICESSYWVQWATELKAPDWPLRHLFELDDDEHVWATAVGVHVCGRSGARACSLLHQLLHLYCTVTGHPSQPLHIETPLLVLSHPQATHRSAAFG